VFVEHSRLRCKINWSRELPCRGYIKVSGYDINGLLKHEDFPMSNVHVFLNPLLAIPPKYDCYMEKIPSPIPKSYICYTISDENGGYQFKTVP